MEDIQRRKGELNAEIRKKRERIGGLWGDLFTPKPANNRGELAANIIGNCVTAFDTFMLARKLMLRYGHLFGRKKRKGRR